MGKEEYLNIIGDEVKKNRELLNESKKSIEFYKRTNEQDKLNEELKNKKLYETRIIYLSGLIKLPLYFKINNMTITDLNKYKEKDINSLNKEIDKLKIKLSELENNIFEIDSNINKIYELYKISSNNIYIEDAKTLLQSIKEKKNELENVKNIINNLYNEKENIIKLDRNEMINKLFNQYELNNIEEELKLYVPNKIDKLVVPMCKDLNILDSIIEEMEKYNKLNNNKVCETIYLPRILNSYTFDDSYSCSLNYFSDLGNSELKDNVLKIYDVNDFDRLLENVGYGLNKIDKDYSDLIKIKGIIEVFPKNITNYELHNLKFLTDKVLKNGRTIDLISIKKERTIDLISKVNRILESIEDLDKEFYLLNKRIKTNNIKNKIELIKREKDENTKEVLNKLWFYITKKLEELLERIDNNYKLESKINELDLDEYDDEVLIEMDNYNYLNLFNVENLIIKTLNKYDEIKNNLNELKNNIEIRKDEFIKRDEKIRIKMNNSIDTINSLYSNVSNEKIDTLDYSKIIDVFKNNTIIDSIVVVEREELINKVKSECAYNDYSLDIKNDCLDKEEIKEEGKKEEEKKVSEDKIIDNKEHEEISENDKLKSINFKKIYEFISSLGLDFNTFKSLLDKLLCDEKICDILEIEGINISEVNLDNYSNLNEMIIDLYTKFDLDEESLKRIGKTLISKKSLLFSVLSSNKKVLFNVLKSDVIKKLLKK